MNQGLVLEALSFLNFALKIGKISLSNSLGIETASLAEPADGTWACNDMFLHDTIRILMYSVTIRYTIRYITKQQNASCLACGLRSLYS